MERIGIREGAPRFRERLFGEPEVEPATGADEEEGKRDSRSAPARGRAAKADGVTAGAQAGDSPRLHQCKEFEPLRKHGRQPANAFPFSGSGTFPRRFVGVDRSRRFR